MERKVAGKLSSGGSINHLIGFLEAEKQKGATEWSIHTSYDRFSSYSWIETIHIVSDEEIKKRDIELLEKKLNDLKAQK